MPKSPNGDRSIVLEDANGLEYQCRVLDIVTLEGKDYAVVLGRAPGDADESLVILRCIEQPAGTSFRVIESDEEFERVSAYVKALAE